jgi:carboxymethylenebutenolidase
MALYTAFDIDAGVRDVEATVAAVRALPETSGRVGVMGFCLGGLLTFLTAARTRLDAAVAFHGARTEEFLGEVADIDAPLQMHLAGEDEFMPKEAQRSIAVALASNSNCEVFSYSGCRHAFSRHGGTHFDADAARQSRTRTLEFFNRNLA